MKTSICVDTGESEKNYKKKSQCLISKQGILCITLHPKKHLAQHI